MTKKENPVIVTKNFLTGENSVIFFHTLCDMILAN